MVVRVHYEQEGTPSALTTRLHRRAGAVRLYLVDAVPGSVARFCEPFLSKHAICVDASNWPKTDLTQDRQREGAVAQGRNDA